MNISKMTMSDLMTAILTGSDGAPEGGVAPGASEAGGHPFEVGKLYFIRTVTHHHTGKLVAVFPNELVLEDAAWIPIDGRFANALASCDFEEVEPFPPGRKVIIGRASLIDACQIDKVPDKQK